MCYLLQLINPPRARAPSLSSDSLTHSLEDLQTIGIDAKNLDGMSLQIRGVLATREKQKGNECFKADELEEAHLHYSRSLVYDSTNHIVLANRAMASIKLGNFAAAETDVSVV